MTLTRITLAFLVLTFSAYGFSTTNKPTLSQEISETVNYLNSMKLLKDAAPIKAKYLNENGKRNLKKFIEHAGNQPMPYFSHFGRGVAAYGANSQSVQFVIFSHKPFVISIDNKIYSYKNAAEFIEKTRVPSVKKYSFLDVMIPQAYASNSLPYFFLGYASARAIQESRPYEVKNNIQNNVVVNNQNNIKMPDVMTIRTMNEKEQADYKQAIDAVSAGVFKSFPNSTCDSKNLLPDSEVSYGEKDNVMTISLRAKSQDKALELRYNGITGESISGLCDKNGKCTRIDAGEIGALNPILVSTKAELEKTAEKQKAQLKPITEARERALDKIRKEHGTPITHEQFINENNIVYSNPTSADQIWEHFTNQDVINRLHKQFLKSKAEKNKWMNGHKTGGSVLAWYGDTFGENSELNNKKKFQAEMQRQIANLRANKKDPDSVLLSMIQSELYKTAQARRPIKSDKEGQTLFEAWPNLRLSAQDENRYRKKHDEMFIAIRDAEMKVNASYDEALLPIRKELGLSHNQNYWGCNHHDIVTASSEQKITFNFEETQMKCNIESSMKRKIVDLDNQLSKLSVNLKDFAACCLDVSCKTAYHQRKAQKEKADTEMSKGFK